jgi:hypothetical protein
MLLAFVQVNLQNTLEHCGKCNASCVRDNANMACVNGQCVFRSCIAPYVNCDGNITNGCEALFASSTKDCGSCGNTCFSARNYVPTCITGVCGGSCSSGYRDCNGNLASDGCEVCDSCCHLRNAAAAGAAATAAAGSSSSSQQQQQLLAATANSSSSSLC